MTAPCTVQCGPALAHNLNHLQRLGRSRIKVLQSPDSMWHSHLEGHTVNASEAPFLECDHVFPERMFRRYTRSETPAVWPSTRLCSTGPETHDLVPSRNPLEMENNHFVCGWWKADPTTHVTSMLFRRAGQTVKLLVERCPAKRLSPACGRRTEATSWHSADLANCELVRHFYVFSVVALSDPQLRTCDNSSSVGNSTL